MRRSIATTQALCAFAVALVLAGCGGDDDGVAAPAAAAKASGVPATERVLLGAPEPGRTERGVFLADLQGQVDELAAGGRLVAWTVRTPADRLDEEARRRPVRLPATTRIVVVDERGGAPLRIDVERPWVRALRMIRGPRGAAEPQLAVRSCTTRRRESCRDELLTLTPQAPLKVVARTSGADAEAAVEGGLDSGRRLDVAGLRPGKRPPCTATITVREPGAGAPRRLPPLPKTDRNYPRCDGVTDRLVTGSFVFVTVHRTDPKHSFEAELVHAIDLSEGTSARWRVVQTPFRATDASTGFALGPAVTDGALVWEELDEEGVTGFSLERVALPDAVRRPPAADTPTTSEPVAPGRPNACAIAATDAAIYELGNPRCTFGLAESGSAEIRRVVRPPFRPAPAE